MRELESRGLPELPPKKKFKPKFNLPTLKDYSKPASDDFWEVFPKNFNCPAKSMIDGDVLYKLAKQVGYPDSELLEKVTKWIKFGADIGCTGDYRLASTARNSKSALEEGNKVTDSICDWIHKGFAYGPLEKSDLPKNAKINSIMTRAKPNGSVRVILNLSSPVGAAVNEGINSSDFPTKMSSTNEWLGVLKKAGKECYICKVDWQAGDTT